MLIFETLLEQLPLGVAYLDAKLRFVHINARLAAMNGLPAAGHIGKSVLEIMPMLAASAEGIARRILETVSRKKSRWSVKRSSNPGSSGAGAETGTLYETPAMRSSASACW
jgi:PAS domain-containing protein